MTTGVIWAGLFWYHGLSGEALRGAVFLTILFGIALTDARYYIIPDEFSLGGLVLGLAAAFLPLGPTALEAVLGAALGFGLLLGVAQAGKLAFKRDAMGGGDIKMMAMIGAFLGIPRVDLTWRPALRGAGQEIPISRHRGLRKRVRVVRRSGARAELQDCLSEVWLPTRLLRPLDARVP